MKKAVFLIILCILLSLATPVFLSQSVSAAGATMEVRVVKFSENETAVIAEQTVSYEWMESNLPVHGDGVTHYYHQGPVFEGDKWDPQETSNLKDKGAVKGTNIKDLCELVGGMSPGDDVMILAADGYHVEFDYDNVYVLTEVQGPIVLCWYNGEEPGSGERCGEGYPDNGEYRTAMRTVFFARTKNSEGKYVFGNWDMHECLPDKCQHFYEAYPSTNGLSMKWVDEIRIYSGGYTGEEGGPAKTLPGGASGAEEPSDETPWVPIAGGVVGGVVVIGLATTCFLRRNKSEA